MLVNTLIVPLFSLEWILMSENIDDNIFSEWMFTFVFLTFMPLVNMI